MRQIVAISLFGAVALLATTGAQAGGPFSGNFVAAWSDPVLSGNIIDAATGIPAFMDNSATAACSITGCPSSATFTPGPTTLAWGANSASSTLNFDGHFFTDVGEGDTFDMGTITYFNGTSALNTLIFGATLNLTYMPFGGRLYRYEAAEAK
jgi:hypothetical protein